jgi:large repetitive protein
VLRDDGGTANGGQDTSLPRSFTITVRPINDAPAFTAGADQSVDEDAGARTVNGWASGISAGPANESAQALTFTVNVTNATNPALFAAGPAVSAAGELTYTPAADQNGAATITLRIGDDGGTANGGVDASAIQTFVITVNAVNDAPALTAGGALAYSENQAATAVDGTVAVADLDSASLVGATVAITGNYASGQDVLSYAAALGISGTFDAGTGTLTLTGTASAANYQTALRNVRYANSSNDPSTLARTVTWQVDDGGAVANLSNTPTSAITVATVNDPPTATGFTNLPVQAGIPITYPAGTLGGTDVEAGTTITLATTPDSVTGGAVTINGDGSFTFTSSPNTAAGSASFTYHVSDNGNPAPGANSAPATVSFSVSGPEIYFVKAAAVGAGDCTLGAECTLGTALTNIGARTNTRIYVNDGGGCCGNMGVTLNSGGWLIGPGVTGTTFDALFGIAAPAQGTLAARPTLGGQRPTLTGASATVTVHTGSAVRGLDVNVSAGANRGLVGAGRTGVVVTDLDVTSAGGNAIDLTNTSADFTGGGLNVVSTSGTGFSATGGGTITVTGGLNTISSTTGRAIVLKGVSLGSAGVTFATIGVTGSPTNLDALSFTSVSGPGAFSGGAVTVAGTTTGGDGIDITGSAAGFSFASATVNNAAGAGINLSGSNGVVTFTTVSISGAGGAGIAVANNTNAVSVNGGSIGNTTGADFAISGGSGNVTYSGTITDDVGPLVSVASATGGTKSFSGAITDGGDGDGSGIALTSNTGATISFSGGLTLSTGANPAFAATGGGTVNVTGGTNTIATTTGTSLNVTGTELGGAGLTFRSIAAGTTVGSTGNGIILDNTGTAAANGGVTVTGTGAAGSGGTIQHKTGADGSLTTGIGIYLNNTKNTSLSWMRLNDFDNYAIRGLNVNGFTLNGSVTNAIGAGKNGTSAASDEGSVSFGVRAGTTGLTGTASVTNTTIEDGLEDTFSVFNASGSLTLTMDNISVSGSGNDGVVTQSFGTATVSIDVRNSDFSSNVGDHFSATGDPTGVNSPNLTVHFGDNGANTLTGGAVGALGQGVTVQTGVGWAGTGAAFISNNSINGAVDTPININIGGPGTFRAMVHNNTIGTSGVVGSGSTGNKDAIRLIANGDASVDATPDGGTFTAAVTSNTIQQVSGRGIYALARDGGTSGDPIALNLTIRGNVLRESPTSGGQGIRVEAGATSTDDVRVHADIGGAGAPANVFADDWGTNLPSGIDFDEIRITHGFSGTSQFILTGLGANTANTATVATYLAGRNTLPGGGVGVASATIAGGGVYETGGPPPTP